jgi:hypothetical protein
LTNLLSAYQQHSSHLVLQFPVVVFLRNRPFVVSLLAAIRDFLYFYIFHSSKPVLRPNVRPCSCSLMSLLTQIVKICSETVAE